MEITSEPQAQMAIMLAVGFLVLLASMMAKSIMEVFTLSLFFIGSLLFVSAGWVMFVTEDYEAKQAMIGGLLMALSSRSIQLMVDNDEGKLSIVLGRNKTQNRVGSFTVSNKGPNE